MPGERITHTLHLKHIGMAGPTDTVKINISGQRWRTSVTPSSVTLAPCQSITVSVVTTIPINAGKQDIDTLTLTVNSSLLSENPSAVLRTKTPAPVLLIDDDRWYQMESYYQEALEARDIPYDVWSTRHEETGFVGAYSPHTDTLRLYPIVLWFTGYDWHRPIRDEEESRLIAYLDDGGRLLLSSLEFLYKHEDGPLACRLGVSSHNEFLNPTRASGVPDHPAGGSWGPVKLFYPYPNWADAIEPRPEATTIVRGQKGQPLAIVSGNTISLATSCDISLTEHTWRTLFYAYPIETMPLNARVEALMRAVGWLSPLGQSGWTVEPSVLAAPQNNPTFIQPQIPVTASLILRNDIKVPVKATISHTLHPSLTLIANTLPAGVTYNPSTRRIHWSGSVPVNQPLIINWKMQLAAKAPAGLRLNPVVAITIPELGNLTFSREAALRVGGPNLAASEWLAPEEATFVAGKPTTVTLALHNIGPDALQRGEVQLWAIRGLGLITATKFPSVGTQVLAWQGELAAGATELLTIPLRTWHGLAPLRVDALIEDHTTQQRWERRLWLTERRWRYYFPVILRSAPTQVAE